MSAPILDYNTSQDWNETRSQTYDAPVHDRAFGEHLHSRSRTQLPPLGQGGDAELAGAFASSIQDSFGHESDYDEILALTPTELDRLGWSTKKAPSNDVEKTPESGGQQNQSPPQALPSRDTSYQEDPTSPRPSQTSATYAEDPALEQKKDYLWRHDVLPEIRVLRKGFWQAESRQPEAEDPSVREFGDDIDFGGKSIVQGFYDGLNISAVRIKDIPARTEGQVLKGKKTRGTQARKRAHGKIKNLKSRPNKKIKRRGRELPSDDNSDDTDLEAAHSTISRRSSTAQLTAEDGSGSEAEERDDALSESHMRTPRKHPAHTMQAYSEAMALRIDVAKGYFKLFLAQLEPFPFREKRREMILKAIAASNEKRKTEDPEIDLVLYPFIFYAVEDAGPWLRSKIREKAKKLVRGYWRDVFSGDEQQIKQAVQRLLKNGNFLQKDFNATDPLSKPMYAFKNPVIAYIISTVFVAESGGSGDALTHPDLFDTAAPTTIALVAAYMHHALEHYIDGIEDAFQGSVELDGANYKTYLDLLGQYKTSRALKYFDMQQELREICESEATLHQADAVMKRRIMVNSPTMPFNSQ
ncbi:hypothetical protein CALVIDRAFT_561076 [Calocera viscosa TUFC12733]|uniref:DUF6532 domain-containing protein n=1 Tax=Calocera viscosa (strain TUFC12733) TaxID=1330018 RepID=A0A167QGV5_CALVF|nr:hypothetical protein CALVIDRAFT_561076 [Calocera viscosa TUFC12733]